MSIRLRLTLLYTAILALTLASLGAVLYGIQFRSMRFSSEEMLAGFATRMIEFRKEGDRAYWDAPPPRPPGMSPDEERRFSSPVMYLQVTDKEEVTLYRSDDLEDIDLPLSQAGQEAMERGESWTEAAEIENERLLIHSAPVVIDGEIVEIIQVAQSLAEQDQYLGTMRRNLLIGSGLAVIVAFGTGWVLSGAVLRPIHDITETARAIGANQDLSQRVEHAGPNDELGHLATTFNTMLSELEFAYRQQQQFVADVSHELRTPLTTLRGNLELLRKDPPIGSAEQEENLSDMVEESERLSRLVNNLLILARTDARQLLRRDPVVIRPLIQEVCRHARLLDPTRSITCDPLPDAVASGDPDALKQILLILIDNALKHTPGPITVTADAGDTSAAIRIQDSGPGIAPDVLPHLFERFYRGQAAADDTGVGLGLAIAKALVEAQEGMITVESEVERGSVFTVTVPLADS